MQKADPEEGPVKKKRKIQEGMKEVIEAEVDQIGIIQNSIDTSNGNKGQKENEKEIEKKYGK